MSAWRRIHDFRRRAAVASALLAGARGVLRAIPFALGLLLIAALADRFFVLPSAVRVAAWFAAVGVGLGALASGFWPLDLFRPGAQSRALAARFPGTTPFREDDLRLAIELEHDRSGGSEGLREAFVASVSDRLDAASPVWCFPRQPWKKLLGIAAGSALAAALVAALPGVSASLGRVVNPFVSASVEANVRITPGDARVAEGTDVEVRLEPTATDAPPADLLLRTESGWDVATPETDGVTRLYRLKNVLQPIVYRVRWRGETSRRFQITPVARVRITSVSVRVVPPAYTGKGAVVQSSPEIAALVGSEAEVSAEASLDLSNAVVQFSDGREKAVVTAGRTLKVSFPVAADGTYRFRVTDRAGEVTETESYPITASPDQPPQIDLLSPTEPLAIGEREKLPLTFEARDDVALAEIRVEWEGGRGKGAITALRFRDGRQGGIQTYSWDLAASGLKPGDRIRYRLAAVDANTVTGPGVGRTGWMDLEIASFEREHAAIEQALEAWRDKSVDLLAKINTLKSRAQKGTDSNDALSSEFNGAAQLSSQLEQAMKAIAGKMQDDPLSDYGVWTEHQAIADSYSAMNNTMVPQTRGALSTGNKQAAAQSLDAMANEIERMTSLSEELTKRQHARDAMESGDRLEKLGQDLADKLENASANDPALMSQLNELMGEAMKNLQDLARSLQQMPNQLPEDFVNQQALKNIKIGSAQDMLQKIANAVKAGDMKTAMRLAQDFLKMTRDMRKNLSEAHESYTKSSQMSELQKRIEEQAKKLQDAVDRQRSILSGTQGLETKRLEREMKEQEAAFAKLAERQRQAIDMLNQTVPAIQQVPQGMVVVGQAPPMIEVYRELQTRKVEKSFDYLASIANQLRAAEPEIAQSSAAAAAPNLRKIADEETAILDELKKLRDSRPAVPSNEKPQYDSLKGTQESLAKSTQELRQGFQALSRKTASLGLPLTDNLNRAAVDMRAAGQSLGESDSRSALSREQSALSSLLEAQSTLEQAQDAMSAMSSGSSGGGGGSPRIIARPAGSQGQKGSKTSPVRFPTADDYRPPREFREDLMESLKENYPKIYEDIIHRYYRRLAD